MIRDLNEDSVVQAIEVFWHYPSVTTEADSYFVSNWKEHELAQDQQ
jgi:hypothetical protein